MTLRDHGSNLTTLIRHIDPGLPLWVLVDPILGEPLPLTSMSPTNHESRRALRAGSWGRDVHDVRLIDTTLPVELHPYLVTLHGADDLHVAECVDIAEREHRSVWQDGLAGSGRGTHGIGGWLQSEADVTTVSHQLALLMRLRTQARVKATYLRLADRRTLDWLDIVVGHDKLSSAFGALRRWVWLDSCGSVSCLERTSTEAGDDALRMSKDEWATFELAQLVHPTLARWLGEVELQANRTGHSAAFGPHGPAATRTALLRTQDAVLAARSAAQRWPQRLPRADDLCAWAAMSLLHPGFEKSTDVLHWLDSHAATHDDLFHIHCHSLRAALDTRAELTP